ncbi:MAG: hypothetical protein ACLFV7_12380, partial [Phycisphaerae bacterium]
VTASDGSKDQFSLPVQLRRDAGPRSGGHVFYEMSFTRREDGSYEGTFTEVAGEQKTEGTLRAVVNPPQKKAAAEHKPIESGEHPRLLLRADDLPRLKARLKTPFGQAFLARAADTENPVLLGLLYQLTGEDRYAREALRIVKGYSDIDGNAGLTGNIGHQLVRVVLTIDLCHDAWPKEYREDLLRQVKGRLPKRQYDLIIPHANYNQVSNYYGPGFGSAAIASLLLHKRRGAAPEQPLKPLCVRFEDCKVPSVEGYNPPQGVPVVPLVDDELPKDWIYAGGLKPAEGKDPLDALGGGQKARPMLGDEMTDGSKSVRFARVSREKDEGYFEWGGREVLDVSNAIGRVYHSYSVFYTVVRNSKPGWYEFNIGSDHKESRTFLNGIEIREGDVMQLEKGLYTLLVEVRIGQTEPWGREMLAARFTHLQDKKVGKRTVAEVNDEIRARYRQAQAFWKTETAEWKARDGQDLDCLRMVHKAREQMYQHLRFGIGNGGFQAEATHYGNIAAYYPLLYATFFRTAMGRDVSTYPDATHVLPRQMMQSYLKNSHPVIMDLNVKGHFDPRWVANNFPMVPGKLKPSLLWGWNRILGVEVPSPDAIDRKTADAMLKPLSGHTLAATYVNYPLGAETVHPSKGMPRTWAADTLGFYVFRSGWQGSDEFIAQVFTKSIPIRAWSHPNAGAFRLWGLGHRWTAAPIERSGYRPEECIVLLPENVMNESASGKVAYCSTGEDGSGSLTIDMSDVYMAVPEPKKKTELESMADDLENLPGDAPDNGPRIGDTRLPDKIVDVPKAVTDYYRQKERSTRRRKLPKLYNWYAERRTGIDYKSPIDGERAIAFDYSGKSGAPCLMVLVDEVRGGSTKQWLWHMPPSENATAETKDNTFAIRYPDATLKGTFISPQKIAPRFLENQKMHFIYRGGSKKGNTITREYDFIAAETDAKTARFFVVITIQKGTPPRVTTGGSGKDTVVTVGDQTVRYRDGKIVFGSGK